MKETDCTAYKPNVFREALPNSKVLHLCFLILPLSKLYKMIREYFSVADTSIGG